MATKYISSLIRLFQGVSPSHIVRYQGRLNVALKDFMKQALVKSEIFTSIEDVDRWEAFAYYLLGNHSSNVMHYVDELLKGEIKRLRNDPKVILCMQWHEILEECMLAKDIKELDKALKEVEEYFAKHAPMVKITEIQFFLRGKLEGALRVVQTGEGQVAKILRPKGWEKK